MKRRMILALVGCVAWVSLVVAGMVLSVAGVAQASVHSDAAHSSSTSSTTSGTTASTPSTTPSTPSPSSPSSTPTRTPTRTVTPRPTPSKTIVAPTHAASASSTPTATSTTTTPSATATPTRSATVAPDQVSNDPSHPTRSSNGWLYLLIGSIGAVAVVAGAWVIGMRRSRSQ